MIYETRTARTESPAEEAGRVLALTLWSVAAAIAVGALIDVCIRSFL